jgi:hypothetical protein
MDAGSIYMTIKLEKDASYKCGCFLDLCHLLYKYLYFFISLL